MTKRKSRFILLSYVFGLVIITSVFHEVAHYVSALIIGVPINDISIGFLGINPSVSISERFADADLAIYHFAGGIFTGIMLVTAYALYWYRKFKKEPSIFIWLMGFITITIGGFQLAQGFIEGRFHNAYIYYALTSPILNILSIYYILALIVTVLIHFSLCPRSQMKRI